MQDPRLMNPRKQKSQKAMIPQVAVDYMRGYHEAPPALPLKSSQKAFKKGMKNDSTLYYRPQERSRSSMQQESTAANEYRALRRKFLELEEESCNLGNELGYAEHEIKTLEDEKLELLDQLIVLEGLVDPSEVHNQ